MSEQGQAQGPPRTEPSPQHVWLKRFLGDWTCEWEETSPEGDKQLVSGSERAHAIGDLRIVSQGSTRRPDSFEMTTLLTLGFDPQKGRFVGTWLGSVMTYLWLYDGELDASGTTLTLYCEGPDMSDSGGTDRYRDVREFRDDDHRVLGAEVLDKDGRWQRFMEVPYHRSR